MSVRVLPDGRLRLETGVTLDRSGDWLDRDSASLLASRASYIIHASYPSSTDVTGQADLVDALLARVDARPDDVGACWYRGGHVDVLLLQEFH